MHFDRIKVLGKELFCKIPRIVRFADKPLIINDFSGYNQPYHPSVLYFAGGFCGYRYWMVQTPFRMMHLEKKL